MAMIAVDLQVFGYGYRIYTMWKGLDWHKAYGKVPACNLFHIRFSVSVLKV